MQNKVYQIFTPKDFDGAVSLLTIIWSKPNDIITYKEYSPLQIEDIKEYINKTINPPNILVLDLCLNDESISAVDNESVTIINHEEKTEKFLSKFKKAKLVYKKHLSSSLCIRNLLKEKAPGFTIEQKKLVLLADDYNSYEFKYPESYDLNIIFWTEFKNDFCRFINNYKNGFKPFTNNQLKIIKEAKDNAKKTFLNLKCYSGKILIEGQPKNVLAVMSSSYNSIVIDMLMKNYDIDLLFYINTNNEKVSLRQKKGNNMIDLEKFSKTYCDGDGYSYAAGGKITPLFMELTKNLNHL
jgi:hypothetical protein